jgi:hypothetical protein
MNKADVGRIERKEGNDRETEPRERLREKQNSRLHCTLCRRGATIKKIPSLVLMTV